MQEKISRDQTQVNLQNLFIFKYMDLINSVNAARLSLSKCT